MNQKRCRSVNWDEEEKQILRSVLKDYAHIIENKCIDTYSNKHKIKAWEAVYKKFNELNSRFRQLHQLKIQWKVMKINARKTYSRFQKETPKTGCRTRPAFCNDVAIEVNNLLNPAELLRDEHNVYDSDGTIPSSSTNESTINTSDSCAIADSLMTETCINNTNNINHGNHQIAEIMYVGMMENVDVQEHAQEFTPLVSSKDDAITATPVENEKGFFSLKKDHDYNASSMITHSKILKDKEHKRQLEMAEEEHDIKMAIHKEKLKCAILEREILELKKEREEKNLL